jgi:hypothetical protein
MGKRLALAVIAFAWAHSNQDLRVYFERAHDARIKGHVHGRRGPSGG